jgi:GntP family gluconate:H+ symporter
MSGLWLVILLVAAILFIIVATSRLKMHPFLVLLAVAYGLGLLAGIAPADIISAIVGGFGGTIGAIGIIIAAGTLIGVLLERSGGAQVMANAIIALVGKARSVMAMSVTGSVVSIPVFCDSGFVILSPLARSLAKQANRSVAVFATALSMGLYATHVFVPPTPGPIAAAGTLGADVGLVILLGLVVTIPVLVTTYLYARFAGERLVVAPPTDLDVTPPPANESERVLPAAWKAFTPILLPVVLITLNSIAALPTRPFGVGAFQQAITFIGNPNTALLLGVVAAFLLLVPRQNRSALEGVTARALQIAGPIILITGAGGALGGVLRATPITEFLAENLALTALGVFLPFLVAAALKTAQGSSTVAIVTTAAIMAPLVPVLGFDSAFGLVLVTLAIGAGSMTVSHANDSYFWVVSQLSGMNVAQAYRMQTGASAVAGITGIVAIFILSLFA